MEITYHFYTTRNIQYFRMKKKIRRVKMLVLKKNKICKKTIRIF